ncbi:type ISP restriction/modification enzyme [Asticcacaulis excentricus]|uniref:site-specific DNA-methyltransferase (adenine-specific) n=1 Tax=Asticcacaulis excentricus TaxID=78587 RepID=A0A3G9G1F5_9CAUL|nr:type ISP restriction/modification enzyme [Asticcacaulis excentricus]BBF80476.1 helicase domain protein [Asticcacaulis excentricus]
MSQILIQQFLNELTTLKKVSGSLSESVIREAFKDLLKGWAKQSGLVFAPELRKESAQKTAVIPDGTILHDLRVPLGYWESKDTQDDLDEEIRKKRLKGYPTDNIIFENSHTAVLIQNGNEVMRAQMLDTKELNRLLSLFFAYERKEIADFRRAVAQFKSDLPAVLEALRERIDDAYAGNAAFKTAAEAFLAQAKATINPAVTETDVREMLIQHILTEEIFAHVFNEGDFHRENNIAQALYGLEAKFFTGAVKRETLKAMEAYYSAIRANAAMITSHAEKQTFLKVIYENFYKVYNPKAADRLGVVYTPNEIVRFMIEGADWLTQKHFGRSLIDKDVQILDPATGTGTFICELIDYFKGQPDKLHRKYKEELHANEVAILPYYVANLNIEATYAAATGQFAEYPNLCFVDTLDNVAALGLHSGHQHDMFAALSDENIARVKRQNQKTISVIIGNPPYNANQKRSGENNKNRKYQDVDRRIKETYLKFSSAQKTKLYDPFVKFFRWSSDRSDKSSVIAFVTNRKFLDGKNFDGFRKVVASEFSDIFIVDLGGDYKGEGVAAGESVFDIGTGVAISFLVKKDHKSKAKSSAKLYYAHPPIGARKEDKLAWLASNSPTGIRWVQIEQDAEGYWLNHPDEQFVDELFIGSKDVKSGIAGSKGRAIFRKFSLGISTNRDDWVYGKRSDEVESKVKEFISEFEKLKISESKLSEKIKLSETMDRKIKSRYSENYNDNYIVNVNYRPFVSLKLYLSPLMIDRPSINPQFFGEKYRKDNKIIVFTDPTAQKPWLVGCSKRPVDLHFVGSGAGSVCFARYFFNSEGERIDNITDWGLKTFEAKYGKGQVSKDDIFAYCYGVLHDPVYRETYAQNLKRDFPRVPLYDDFARWRDWGQALLDLHIGYEGVEPFGLTRVDTPDTRARAAGLHPTPKLKSDAQNGMITLDSETVLTGVPSEAFDYRLGNRSAIDWVLDQYKEKTPKDKTIREKFNTYRFADYKETVIDLLQRVTTVSVKTVAITEAMRAVKR